MAAVRNESLLASVTLPRRPLAACTTGTRCTVKVDVVWTSMAIGVPDEGNVLLVSSPSATRLSGSTSARMERPGWISEPGTGTFQEALTLPSSGQSGTDGPGGAMVSVVAS